MPIGSSKGYEASSNGTANCVILDEPPDAEPHVRWCERGRLAAAPYSIPAGEPWRSRTSDPLIKSQLLCQLS